MASNRSATDFQRYVQSEAKRLTGLLDFDVELRAAGSLEGLIATKQAALDEAAEELVKKQNEVKATDRRLGVVQADVDRLTAEARTVLDNANKEAAAKVHDATKRGEAHVAEARTKANEIVKDAGTESAELREKLRAEVKELEGRQAKARKSLDDIYAETNAAEERLVNINDKIKAALSKIEVREL